MMSKRLTLLAVAVLLVFAAGCGKNADDPGAKGNTTGGNQTTGSNTNTNSNSTTGGKIDSSGTQTGTQPTGSTDTKTEQPAAKANLGPLKVGEAAKIGPLTVTLTEFAVFDKAAGLPPGYVHFVANVSIANAAKEQYTINVTDHLKMETPEGKKAPFNLQALANKNPRLQGTVETGGNTAGWLGYLTKRVAGNYKFMFIHPDYGQATWEFPL